MVLDDSIYGNKAIKYILLKYNSSLRADIEISFKEYETPLIASKIKILISISLFLKAYV